MELMNSILIMFLILFGIGVLILLMVNLWKLKDTIGKVNTLLDDLNEKSQTLDGLFDTIEEVSDATRSFSTKFIGTVNRLFGKVPKRKRIVKEEDEYE